MIGNDQASTFLRDPCHVRWFFLPRAEALFNVDGIHITSVTVTDGALGPASSPSTTAAGASVCTMFPVSSGTFTETDPPASRPRAKLAAREVRWATDTEAHRHVHRPWPTSPACPGTPPGMPSRPKQPRRTADKGRLAGRRWATITGAVSLLLTVTSRALSPRTPE